jgi:hypothetical protein
MQLDLPHQPLQLPLLQNQQLPHHPLNPLQDVDPLNIMMINGVMMKITMLIAAMMVEHAVTTTFQVANSRSQL